MEQGIEVRMPIPSVDLLAANKYLEVVRKAYDIDLWMKRTKESPAT